ncbi:MAG: protein-L-isoaspartate O-methyltransferase [Patescibacteria group bacterium]
MEELAQKLIDDGYLKTDSIIYAFKKINRADFLPPDLKPDAEVNHPLPIGFGQTISQPLTVAFMLELLQPKLGEHIMDVGSGSCWQTALLAELVGPTGHITAIERVPDLSALGQKNISAYHFNNIQFITGDGTRGYKPAAPYDKIIVAAAAEIGVPDELLKELKVGGRLVIPVGKYEQDMVVMEKLTDSEYHEQRYPGFQFVPLIPRAWSE